MNWVAFLCVLGGGSLLWAFIDGITYSEWTHPEYHEEQLHRTQAAFIIAVLCFAIAFGLGQ